MKCARLCVLAVAAAVLAGASARAETEAEYLHPGPARKQTSPFGRTAPQPAPAKRTAPQSVPPKPRASNPATFAPAAALNSRRMSDQQREEWRFLKDAAAAGRFETEAPRLALAKSNKPGIRSFATTLVNHHTSVSNELVHMLHVRGMAPPMLANDQRKTLNRLAKVQGAKFDRTFMEEVGVKRQHEDVQLFERARLVVGDPQLKAWIERMLPTLRHHLATAERLAPSDSRL
jgi:predicted outer membrane protein